jgi:hypothetical protein
MFSMLKTSTKDSKIVDNHSSYLSRLQAIGEERQGGPYFGLMTPSNAPDKRMGLTGSAIRTRTYVLVADVFGRIRTADKTQGGSPCAWKLPTTGMTSTAKSSSKSGTD